MMQGAIHGIKETERVVGVPEENFSNSVPQHEGEGPRAKAFIGTEGGYLMIGDGQVNGRSPLITEILDTTSKKIEDFHMREV